MADAKSMNEQWVEAQQQYWNAWMDMARRGMEQVVPAPKRPTNPWADALQNWWQAVTPEAPRSAENVLAQMLEMGKSYFGMAENLQTSGLGQDPTRFIEDWTKVVSESFGKWSGGVNPFAAFSQPGNTGQNPFAAFTSSMGKDKMAFWDLPFDTLSRTFSAASPFPGDFMKAFDVQQPLDPRSQVNRFLSAPAVGYARESQEQYQKFARLMLEYERASGEYHAGFGPVNTQSMEIFRDKVQARSEEERPITSVREVFNIWVDACEEAYAVYAMSEEYARRYGKMVNALMAVKKQGSVLVDEWLESMNMPTCKDLSDVHKRLHDTRLAANRLRSQTEMMRAELDGLSNLGTEMVQLREEVNRLRAELANVAVKSATTDSAQTASAPESESALTAMESSSAPAPASAKTTTKSGTASTARKSGTTTRRKTQ